MPTFSTKQEALDWQKKYGGASIGAPAVPFEHQGEFQMEGTAALGAKMKAKYPQYAKIADLELGQKVLKKHPEYQEFVKGFKPAPEKSPYVGFSAPSYGEERKGFEEIAKNVEKTTGSKYLGGVVEAAGPALALVTSGVKKAGALIGNVGAAPVNLSNALFDEKLGERLKSTGKKAVAGTKSAFQALKESAGQGIPLASGPTGEAADEAVYQDVSKKLGVVGDIAGDVVTDPTNVLFAPGAAKGAFPVARELQGQLMDKTADAILAAGRAAEKFPEMGAEAARELSRGAGKAASAAGRGAGEGAKYAVAQATGLNPETVDAALKNVKLPKYREMGVQEGRQALEDMVTGKLDEEIAALSEGGKLYDEARQATTDLKPLDVSRTIDKALAKTVKSDGSKIVTTGTELTAAEGAKIQDAIDQIRADLQSAGAITGQQLHDARRKLDKFIDWADPSVKSANGALKDVRRALDDLAKEKVPGLKELDAAYGPKKAELEAVKKLILDRAGDVKDSAQSTLANLTRLGNEKKLARVEELLPGISEDIRAVKALQDIEYAKGQKVGAYVRGGLLTLGGTAAATGGIAAIPALVAAIATHPTVAVAILEKFGGMKRWLREKILSGKKLTAANKTEVQDAFDKARKAIEEGKSGRAAAAAADEVLPGIAREAISAPSNPLDSVVTSANARLKSASLSGDWAAEGVNAVRIAVGNGSLSPAMAEKAIDRLLAERIATGLTPAQADEAIRRAKWMKERIYAEGGLGLSGDAVPRASKAIQEAAAVENPIFGKVEPQGTSQAQAFLDELYAKRDALEDQVAASRGGGQSAAREQLSHVNARIGWEESQLRGGGSAPVANPGAPRAPQGSDELNDRLGNLAKTFK